jgi:transcriptional regulator with XRE-family HTH domain
MNRPDLLTRLRNQEYREAFISSTISSTIAYQIRGLRKRLVLDQAALGALAGMKQTAISRLENPDYGNLSVNTLKRIARALDVGLIVRFAPFSEILRWRLAMSQGDMAPAVFSEDTELDATVDRIFDGHTNLGTGTLLHFVRVPAPKQSIDDSTVVPLMAQFHGKMPPVPDVQDWTTNANSMRMASNEDGF